MKGKIVKIEMVFSCYNLLTSCWVLICHGGQKGHTVMDFVTCEHGSSLGSKDLVHIDYASLDFKFERGIFEYFNV